MTWGVASAFANDGDIVPCADRSVTAAAVSNRQDIQAFVQCAYEYVQEMGFDEARRAFNEDERWLTGPTYVFVDEVTAARVDARAFVFPPDPSLEGQPWGPLLDAFGDYYEEVYRLMGTVGIDEGWIYYAFRNPATGRDEPKASYIKRLDWDGTPAVIGAGVYSRDLPGTCEPSEVHAMGLESHPSPMRLAEFVRCAAMELETGGYFGIRALTSDPRWRHQSIYLFGLDIYGNTIFTGDPHSLWYGGAVSEVNTNPDGPFLGRDVIGVGDAFGETSLYYSARNPFSGAMQDKAAFVKRVVISGLPILIGSGYYSPAAAPDMSSLTVDIHATGSGAKLGSVLVEDTADGARFTPNLSGLTAGEHGFHVHVNPDCGMSGQNAGGHYDPGNTGSHEGPDGNGHLGDLPRLAVDGGGMATVPVVARRVRVSDVVGRSLMIHAGGDNYSDMPAALGGGGARVACGIASR